MTYFWQNPVLRRRTNEKAVVELYNFFEKGSRFPGNGFYVYRHVDGVRHERLGDFGRDQEAARNFADRWNAEKGGIDS